ncbi:hypothetical protein ACXR6G_17875 [Ancylomarina sp. YFZ004]
MKSKLFFATFILCILNISAFSQLNGYNSFEKLDSLGSKYYYENNSDSSILVFEYARSMFPEYDENATLTLSFLYSKTKQDSMILENWDYGLNKRYFFGINDLQFKQFENNPEFNRLLKIDRQIGDSLNNLAHVEYEVILPADYSEDKEYPLLFVFHGNNRNLQQAKSVWTSKVMQDKFVTVYLQSYIHMSKTAYQWKLNDERTNKEFKEIYEQILKKYPVNKNKIIYLGMSAGGRQAVDYAFNQFVPVNGLVLNCPVIAMISENLINTFINENKKIAIITGENDWALNDQKNLIKKVDSLDGYGKITINADLGHQFAKDFSTVLDEYLNWILE